MVGKVLHFFSFYCNEFYFMEFSIFIFILIIVEEYNRKKVIKIKVFMNKKLMICIL